MKSKLVACVFGLLLIGLSIAEAQWESVKKSDRAFQEGNSSNSPGALQERKSSVWPKAIQERSSIGLPGDDESVDDEGDDECGDGLAFPAPVPRTGQATCWNGNGFPIDCSGTGQDGEYQRGVSVSPRFTVNTNGTVTDDMTGLIWLKDANCFGPQDWTTALSSANGLAQGSCGLTDGSLAGDWRLPNLRELQSLIDYRNISPALPPGHPFSGVQSGFYWSSTTYVEYPDIAWDLHFDFGFVVIDVKSLPNYVWPVRGGQ